MTLLLISFASWSVAVAVYVAVIFITHGRLFVGDTQSLAIWGGVVVAIAVPLAYLPAMLALRKRTNTWWPFPVVGGLLGAVPLMLFMILWNGWNPVAGMFSQAGVILATVFAAFGITFGVGFHVSHAKA